MVSIDTARKLAMSLPEVEERDHFGSPSFRVKGKIFAQLSGGKSEVERALVKLTLADQTALSISAPDVFAPVPQWGKHGWTHVRLGGVDESMLRDLFQRSWCSVAPKGLASAFDGAKATKSRRGG
jgi:hypothetical protein